MDYRNYNQDQGEIIGPHPIWRGIGCILMVVIPIITFVLSDILMGWMRVNVPGFSIPPNLRGSFAITSSWVVNDIWAVVGLTVILSFAAFAVLMIINSMIYAATGTKNLNTLNAPAQKYKPKKKLRKR